MTFADLKAEILSRVKPLELCAAYQKALIAADYDELIDAAQTTVEGVNITFIEWVYLSGIVDESLFAEFPEATLNAHGIYIDDVTLSNPCGDCDETAASLRFGVLGEDDTAAEDRNFDADGNAFAIDNASDVSLGGFGSGTHNGTLSYLTGFDATGKVIEVDPDSIGGGGVTVLKNYVTQTTSTGGGTTDTVVIVNIPAGSLGALGDGLEIEIAYITTGADTKGVDAVIGASGSIVATPTATTAGTYAHKIKLYRTNSTSAICRAETWRTFSFISFAQTIIGSFDWGVGQDLKVKLTSTTAASITINYVTVKLVKE